LEAITESRGDSQGDDKKGKTYTRRSSKRRKKEGEPAAHFGAHVNRTRFRKTGLVKSRGIGPI
jgi:hypothetical protein